METLVITVRDEAQRDLLEKLVREMDGIERIQRVVTPDEVSLLAVPSLAEEWESPEDQRWDALL